MKGITQYAGLRRSLATVALTIGIATVAAPAPAQIVFDPSNYAQNVLTAARALQQINNQITSLTNQTQMLLNQAKNLVNMPTSMLSQIEGNFAKMKNLMAQAQKLAYDVQNIDQQFNSTYQNFATGKTSSQLADGAHQRWQDSLAAYQDALKTGAVAVGNIDGTQTQTSSLVNASQSSVGILQATQAGNQLLGVQARQIADLTAMLAAQGRAPVPRDIPPGRSRGAGARAVQPLHGGQRLQRHHGHDVPQLRAADMDLKITARTIAVVALGSSMIACVIPLRPDTTSKTSGESLHQSHDEHTPLTPSMTPSFSAVGTSAWLPWMTRPAARHGRRTAATSSAPIAHPR